MSLVVAVPVEHGGIRRDAADRIEAREDCIRQRRRGGVAVPSGQKRPRRGGEHQRASQDPDRAISERSQDPSGAPLTWFRSRRSAKKARTKFAGENYGYTNPSPDAVAGRFAAIAIRLDGRCE